MKRAHLTPTLLVLLVCGFLFFGLAGTVLSAEQEKNKEDRPQRGFLVAFEYPAVVLAAGEDLSLDIIVKNLGKRDEDITLKVASAPEGWEARTKTYAFGVRGVHVPEDDFKRVTFEAKPPKGTAPGDYTVVLEAATEDGLFPQSRTLLVTLLEEAKKDEGIELRTSYPVLRGSSDAKFEFSIDVENKLGKEENFNFAAQGPANWEINFKPAYEDKLISSIRMKDNESKNVRVEVTPDRLAKAEAYPVLVRVTAANSQKEVPLQVVITGNYRLNAGTPTGLLSLQTEKGTTGNISIFVQNSGTAPNQDIEFLSVKPENWKVEFTPEKIPLLKPGELRQVEVSVTPSGEALVGDYSVGLTIQGEKASDNLELRVTVNAAATWAWIGIAIIVLVVAGLFFVFIKLGRR